MLRCLRFPVWMLALLAASPALAGWATLDDFNRIDNDIIDASGVNNASNWDERLPYFRIANQKLTTSPGTTAYALATHRTYQGPISFDALHSGTYESQFVAAVLGYDPLTGDHLSVRLQGNGPGSNLFHRVLFYQVDGSTGLATAWPGMTGGGSSISIPFGKYFDTAKVTASLIGGLVSLDIEAFDRSTGVFDPSRVWHYARGGAPSFGSHVGVGAAGPAAIDSFRGIIPEPATALLTLGGVGLLLIRRR